MDPSKTYVRSFERLWFVCRSETGKPGHYTEVYLKLNGEWSPKYKEARKFMSQQKAEHEAKLWSK